MYHQKNANHLIFSDTEFLVTKIWSLVKYKRCHPWIEQMVTSHRYDFYLLCNIDLPWEYDPLREHPEMRQVLFELYIKELGSNELPYAIVSGTGSARLENAIKILEKINF
jgi:nicotinamide riboside kinase